MGDQKHLIVVINGNEVGDTTQNEHGQMRFTYRESWRSSRSATPLSLSLPLVQAEHGHLATDTFLRGLLPDNDAVLERWGRRYGVSARNPFALLTHVGEDVAGAAQFVREDRLAESQDAGSIESVDVSYIEHRLKSLREDRASWTDTRGEFSLAGAQSKFALFRGPDGSWGIPHGRKATTHILKPPIPGLADQEVNEHLCLQAASLLGMATARSEVATFGNEQAIVLERYDRIVRDDGEVVRIHQEDTCQALSVPPDRKYQREDGGPGAAQLIQLFREHQTPAQAAESVETFCRALAFNWAICGPDAHAKNYSLLLAGPQVRLAPLYDIGSIVAYPSQYKLNQAMMAMSINGKYQNNLISEKDWRAFADAVSVEADQMVHWVYDVVSNAPDAFREVVDSEPPWIRDLPMTTALMAGIAESVGERLLYVNAP